MSQDNIQDQDAFVVPVQLLGGIDELGNILDQSPDVFHFLSGIFPQFSGMHTRLPGKVVIQKRSSPIRAIHQAFVPYGTFGFYVESDDLRFFSDCQNPSYRVDPVGPTDLGVGVDDFTLDIFGNDTRGLPIPLAVPNLNFSPNCIGAGDSPVSTSYTFDVGASLSPLSSYTINVFDNDSVQLDTQTYVQGVDFAPGGVFDFTQLIIDNPTTIYFTCPGLPDIFIPSCTPTDAIQVMTSPRRWQIQDGFSILEVSVVVTGESVS